MLFDNLNNLLKNAKKILNTNLKYLCKSELVLLESSCTKCIAEITSELRIIKSENSSGEYDSVLDKIRQLIKLLKNYREEIKAYIKIIYEKAR